MKLLLVKNYGGKLMKVLTIKEPWATLILSGKKTIETRTWATNYRGEVLLHASKNPKSEISGKIFAKCKIVQVKPMIREHEKLACCEIYPNAQSWFLEEVKAVELIEVKGSLGLWDYNGKISNK